MQNFKISRLRYVVQTRGVKMWCSVSSLIFFSFSKAWISSNNLVQKPNQLSLFRHCRTTSAFFFLFLLQTVRSSKCLITASLVNHVRFLNVIQLRNSIATQFCRGLDGGEAFVFISTQNSESLLTRPLSLPPCWLPTCHPPCYPFVTL